MTRALILTSTFLRHHHLINQAAAALNVVGVWQERKAFEPLRYAENEEDERVIRAHFDARDESEATYFSEDARLRLPAGVEHRIVAPTACNDAEELARMKAAAPDVVLVFGTGILKSALIAMFPGRIVNLHLGLSPYYRGAGTNFWPLVNGEPEYVGATIHCLDEGLDSGPIIAHARPEIRADDGPHDLGNRTILSAVQMLLRTAAAVPAGPLLPATPQSGGGRLYRRKDFSASAVRQLYQNFASGMVSEYLANRASRDARVALISPPNTA